MHNIYNIENTTYLNSEKDYLNPDIYPNFQKDYLNFKKEILEDSKNSLNKTYYKFGDGDYLLFKNEKFGTTKPGVRDIKKSIKSLNIEEIKKYGNLHDKYFF